MDTTEERKAKGEESRRIGRESAEAVIERQLYITRLTELLRGTQYDTCSTFNSFGSLRWNTVDREALHIAYAKWRDEHLDHEMMDKCATVFGHTLPSTLAAARVKQRKLDNPEYDVHKYPVITDYLRYGKHTYSKAT